MNQGDSLPLIIKKKKNSRHSIYMYEADDICHYISIRVRVIHLAYKSHLDRYHASMNESGNTYNILFPVH